MRAKQDGLRDAAFLFRRGSGSPLERSRMPCGYRTLWVHFRPVRFFMAIPTGKRSRRRGAGTLLCGRIGFAMLSAERTLRAARPQTCAKESSTLWTLFIGFAAECLFAQAHWPCDAFHGENVGGCAPPNLRQRAIGSLDSLHSDSRQRTSLPNQESLSSNCRIHAPQHSGTRKDPAGSNLWPAGSGCISMLSIRTNVQTRAAPKRRGVGLHARSGEEERTAFIG